MFVDIFQNKSCNLRRLNESCRVFLGNKMKLNLKHTLAYINVAATVCLHVFSGGGGANPH